MPAPGFNLVFFYILFESIFFYSPYRYTRFRLHVILISELLSSSASLFPYLRRLSIRSFVLLCLSLCIGLFVPRSFLEAAEESQPAAGQWHSGIVWMRGHQERTASIISYTSTEERIPASHPLRRMRRLGDQPLDRVIPSFCQLYPESGRPSIPTETALALMLQAINGIRLERMLIEQLDYNLLFRWFV